MRTLNPSTAGTRLRFLCRILQSNLKSPRQLLSSLLILLLSHTITIVKKLPTKLPTDWVNEKILEQRIYLKGNDRCPNFSPDNGKANPYFAK